MKVSEPNQHEPHGCVWDYLGELLFGARMEVEKRTPGPFLSSTFLGRRAGGLFLSDGGISYPDPSLVGFR